MMPPEQSENPPGRPVARTRREFVKTSLVACATATLAAEKTAGAGNTRAPSAPPAADSAARPAGQTVVSPLTPYGSGEPVYLADLERCQPASAVARTWQSNAWKLLDYEADAVSGTMLTAGQNTAVPD